MNTIIPSKPYSGHVNHLRIPAQPENVRVARREVADFAKGLKFPAEDVDAIALAVGEAFSNAVNYGSHIGPDPVIALHCVETARDQVQIDVVNAGNGFQPDLTVVTRLPENDSYSSHGRGFALMSALVDEIKVFSDGLHTTVRLIKRKSK